MTNEDYKYWTEFRAKKTNKLSREEFKTICEMHARLKKHGYFEPCTCNPKGAQRFIDDLNKLYNEHRNNS
jgi:hypothetical protein